MSTQSPHLPYRGRSLASRLYQGITLLLLGVGSVVAVSSIRDFFLYYATIEHYFAGMSLLMLGANLLSAVLCIAAFIQRTILSLKKQWPSHSLVHFRIFFYLLVTMTVMKFIVFSPFHIVLFQFTLTYCFGGFALILLAEPMLRRVVPRRLFKVLDMVFFFTCFLLVAGELGLRIYARFHSSPLLVRTISSVEDKVNMHRYPPGTMRFGYPCNQGGHYDVDFTPKTAGEKLVVVIGDSFSPGTVPLPLHYTKVCERRLPSTRVYNMGLCATGPAEYLYLLGEEARPLNPDLVLIALFVGNDLVDNLSSISTNDSEGSVNLFIRSWFDVQNILLYLIPARMVKIASEENELAFGLDRSLKDDKEHVDELSEVRTPWIEDPMKERPYFSRETFVSIESQRAVIVCSGDTTPYDQLFATLAKIIDASRDTRLAFMLIPDEFQVEDSLWEEITARKEGVEWDRDRPQRLIRSWLKERVVPCLDLLPHMRQTPPMTDGSRHLYHLQNTHFNARGNEIAGKLLADFLTDVLGIHDTEERRKM